jgi:putative hydrolase of the HAD superfamily
VTRALCFDLDGTLAAYAGDFRSYLALLFHELLLDGCDLSRFAEVVREELSRDGPLTLERALRRALARLEQRAPGDLSEMTRTALHAYAEDVRAAPGAAELLERLRRRSVPMALVSNGPVDMQRAALAALGFGAYFRTVLVSGDPDVGTRKPAARIFSLACTGLEVLPSETVMVGDSVADIEGALAYGMQAVLMGSVEQGARLGVPSVREPGELGALLEQRFGL